MWKWRRCRRFEDFVSSGTLRLALELACENFCGAQSLTDKILLD